MGTVWASTPMNDWLLHLPGSYFGSSHHATPMQHVGLATEAEHVNFGDAPIWVVAMFAINWSARNLARSFIRVNGIAPGHIRRIFWSISL